MSALRFSLFSKIMLWFFLNLLMLAMILWLTVNFRFDLRSRFFNLSNRIEAVTRQVESEINERSRDEQNQVLQNYSKNYGVEFFLFDNAGKQLAGREIALPSEVSRNVTQPEAPPGRENHGRSGGRELPPPPRDLAPSGSFPILPPSAYFRTSDPPLYWFVGRIMITEPERREPMRTRLIVASESFTGRGLFFDPTPYIVMAAAIIGFSILFWLPFVRNMTNAIGQITNAAESIAEENFSVRISNKRTDELGRLGKSINHLAERLAGFVTGQKRFLGDISHELNSPLARMQFALTILEDRVDQRNRAYVTDVKEEVELMAKLVAELLDFSKSGIKTAEIYLEKIYLRPLVEKVVLRESENSIVTIEISEDIKVLAQPELLERALANVIRNAVRYAKEAGEIIVSANLNESFVQITVADNGSGVPEHALANIFDPFYRIEKDRARESGGTGLGLAIVKSCVEACQGKVTARNRLPAGFEVIILLQNS